MIIYCLLYYRLLGLITILSLVLSFGLVYAVMVLLGRWMNLSLDMAGIAGLIIAIGITADSFVVYFERLKDEVREGRTFRSAVPRGWERAKRTILSADAVTFLSAAILYILAVGDVKGFAFTLGLSTVLDLVVVFLVTHPLVALASGSKVFTSPTLVRPRRGRRGRRPSTVRPPPESPRRRREMTTTDDAAHRRPRRPPKRGSTGTASSTGCPPAPVRSTCWARARSTTGSASCWSCCRSC